MKSIHSIPALFLLFIIVFASSCKKEETPDTIAPVITLNGDNPATVYLGGTYTDAGATATDETDGDLTSSITSTNNINLLQTGTYTVTYSVTDAAGNTGTETRSVKVINEANYIAAGYSVVDVVTGKNAGTYYYNVSVSAHSTINNKLLIYNFGGFGSLVYAEVTLSGTTLTLGSQNPTLMNDPGTISGSGSTDSTAVTTINYTCIYDSGGSDTGSATFTKI